MQISSAGLIDIIYREGIALEWYYDSENIPTWGIGETISDGINPRHRAASSVKDVIDSFKIKITKYTKVVDTIKLPFSQTQYDALSSACYNFGGGNLIRLCHDRNITEIGQALMFYDRPPEVRYRRMQEQQLYLHGTYTCKDGEVLVFPVNQYHRPDYHHGKMIDIRPYFDEKIS